MCACAGSIQLAYKYHRFKYARNRRGAKLTVQKTIVFEAPPTEQRVIRMHRLLARHALSLRSVNVGRALLGRSFRVNGLRQFDVPARCALNNFTNNS